jgi:hypothetical protein
MFSQLSCAVRTTEILELLAPQILLLEPLNVYVTATQEGMLKLWSADRLKPTRQVENGDGGMFKTKAPRCQSPVRLLKLEETFLVLSLSLFYTLHF